MSYIFPINLLLSNIVNLDTIGGTSWLSHFILLTLHQN